MLDENYINDSLGGVSFVVDDTTGQITGYTTDIGGADSVFPFSGGNLRIDITASFKSWSANGYNILENPRNNKLYIIDGNIEWASAWSEFEITQDRGLGGGNNRGQITITVTHIYQINRDKTVIKQIM